MANVYNYNMKATLKIKLLSNLEESKKLLDTMEVFNTACQEIAEVCYKNQSANKVTIQKEVYYNIKAKYNLSAQLVIRCIAKACESYAKNKKICPKIKKHGSVIYDQRILAFKGLDKVSIITVYGRLKIPVLIRDYFRGHASRMKGQCDLLYINKEFYLYATCDLPEDKTHDIKNIIGVDLGVTNIAVTSEKEFFSNEKVENKRSKYSKLRKHLQKKQTKSAKRKLKKISGKESRFRKDVDHQISKKIVSKAKSTNSAIALEDLKGIKERTIVKKCRKKQRDKRNAWSFYQLRLFISYKAQLAGVPVVIINPAYTSIMCPKCTAIDKNNRKTQSEFCCTGCNYTEHADVVGSINIASAGATSIGLMSSANLLQKAS